VGDGRGEVVLPFLGLLLLKHVVLSPPHYLVELVCALNQQQQPDTEQAIIELTLSRRAQL